MCVGASEQGGRWVSDPPPPFKNMGGAKYVLPPLPHEMCINKLYIY